MENIARSLIRKELNSKDAQIILGQYKYRISMKDGEPLMLTSDFHPTRMNLEIENNIIVKVTFG